MANSNFWKKVSKWSRILHRDVGFFFIGMTIIYGLSGLSLNHAADWNPNYIIEKKNFSYSLDINRNNVAEILPRLQQQIGIKEKYKAHYFRNDTTLKIYFDNNTTAELYLNSHTGLIETLKKRPVFYYLNFLHYNPSRIWTFFSDAYAIALLLFAITSLFMVHGKKGIKGRGGIYLILGIIIPLIILFLSLK